MLALLEMALVVFNDQIWKATILLSIYFSAHSLKSHIYQNVIEKIRENHVSYFIFKTVVYRYVNP